MDETLTEPNELDINRVVAIEPALLQDAEAVTDVHRRTWLATYPNVEAGITEEDIRIRVDGEHDELKPLRLEQWKKSIENTDGSRAVFVARQDGKVVGFCAPGIISGQRRIGAIYVLPEAQSKGLGSQLLERAVEWHGRDEDIFLRAATYNEQAISFYKKHGFEETGRLVEDESEAVKLRGAVAIPEVEMVLKAKLD
ncbi:MAG: GNAT family N-acetyltransferase [Candidatus Saccharibacteria bacterium]